MTQYEQDAGGLGIWVESLGARKWNRDEGDGDGDGDKTYRG